MNPMIEKGLRTPDGRVPIATKLYYGFGAVAYGVKDNGLSFFFLLYYNQVLGLPAGQVGLILLISLVLDGISDPVAGYLSDHFHSRWGRRHPFMYAAALPTALICYFLWNPPEGLAGWGLFSYALIMVVTLRLIITFYETPSTAMVAELTEDYHERTTMLSFRFFFGWAGGLTMSVITYGVLFRLGGEEYGQLNPRGYEIMGLIASLAILISILVSALGTHRYIPHLKQPGGKTAAAGQARFFRAVKEVYETLATRSFMALFASAIFISVAAGMAASLDIYFTTYFWELKPEQIYLIAVGQYFSAILALIFSPLASRRLGKKWAAIVISALAFTILPLPVLLRLLGLFPENGSPALLPLLIGISVIAIALVISASIMISSMVADLAEDNELRSGRRAEGLFFAARTFILKVVTGVGFATATLVLTLIGFPDGARPGEVDPDVIYNLGLVYIPAAMVLWALSILCILGYRITEDEHRTNLEKIKSGAARMGWDSNPRDA